MIFVFIRDNNNNPSPYKGKGPCIACNFQGEWQLRKRPKYDGTWM